MVGLDGGGGRVYSCEIELAGSGAKIGGAVDLLQCCACAETIYPDADKVQQRGCGGVGNFRENEECASEEKV